MTKEELIELAEKIPRPSSRTSQEYGKKREILVSNMNKYMMSRPDLNELIGGEKNIPMMIDNHNNHAKFMENLFTNYSSKALVETMCWVLSAYVNHKINLSYWPAQLNGWNKTLKENLDEESFNEIIPTYDYLISNHALFVQLSGVKI